MIISVLDKAWINKPTSPVSVTTHPMPTKTLEYLTMHTLFPTSDEPGQQASGSSPTEEAKKAAGGPDARSAPVRTGGTVILECATRPI